MHPKAATLAKWSDFEDFIDASIAGFVAYGTHFGGFDEHQAWANKVLDYYIPSRLYRTGNLDVARSQIFPPDFQFHRRQYQKQTGACPV